MVLNILKYYIIKNIIHLKIIPQNSLFLDEIWSNILIVIIKFIKSLILVFAALVKFTPVFPKHTLYIYNVYIELIYTANNNFIMNCRKVNLKTQTRNLCGYL